MATYCSMPIFNEFGSFDPLCIIKHTFFPRDRYKVFIDYQIECVVKQLLCWGRLFEARFALGRNYSLNGKIKNFLSQKTSVYTYLVFDI